VELWDENQTKKTEERMIRRRKEQNPKPAKRNMALNRYL
jgi:hypothetical protein